MSRLGGCKDFAFIVLLEANTFDWGSAALAPWFWRTKRASVFSTLSFRLVRPRFGGSIDDISAPDGTAKVPGPMDFRGAFVFAVLFELLKEFGGKWLCRLLLRIDVVVGAAAMDSDLDELRLNVLEALLCCLCSPLFLPTELLPDTFLKLPDDETGWGMVLQSSEIAEGVVFGCPGSGKLGRAGSVEVIL